MKTIPAVVAISDVLSQGGVKQDRLLRHDAHPVVVVEELFSLSPSLTLRTNKLERLSL
jgi:hypothetical protein